jgi:hypothetical protein
MLDGRTSKIVPSEQEGRSGLVLTPEEIELQEEIGKRIHKPASNFALTYRIFGHAQKSFRAAMK